mgnify:FL=1
MKLLVLFCLLTATFVCKAQQIPSATEIASLPLWSQKMYGENPNALEVSELYRNFYREHDFEKNYHTQYFKRWKRSVITKIDDQGFVLNFTAEQLQKIDQDYLKKQSQSKSSNWTAVGPITNYHASIERPNRSDNR